MKASQSAVALGILLLLAWGCEQAPEPVASVRIEPAGIELPYPGFAKVEMQWDLATALDGFAGGPRVFGHRDPGDS